MRSFLLFISLVLTSTLTSRAAAASLPHALMPAPAEYVAGTGVLPVTQDFTVAIAGHDDARLRHGIARALRRWEERTGFTFGRPLGAPGNRGTLVIHCESAGNAYPQLHDDESYTIEVTPAGATLRAPNVVGALRGLETLLQLLDDGAEGFFVPAVRIQDAARFPWRGLLVDPCRHWQPMPVIKRILDGMALAKLNVMHFHLTEDQGFRVESKRFPRLHEMGSDGNYFTQDEIREIIDYAAERGIRVVPEFDMPGHATSWVVGHPEIASLPGPYEIERKWGIFDPTLDPTNERTYEILDGFLGEMAALFPDPYLHIGGDENNGKQWDANPQIQAFIREHDLKDNHGLQAYFNRRVLEIITKHGKRMVGWDEIFHPSLPRNVVIHSWRGPDSLAETARQGYDGILSNGYYIDLSHPARDHYLNDPLPEGTTLTAEQQKHVLGGEATMWAEWVTPETIDSRIWPRAAAVAERLWSPQHVRDVDDMYRRLAIVSLRLEELGLSLTRHVDFMVGRLAGDNASAADREALRLLADLVEPVKDYRRGQYQPDTTQFSPLTGLVDCARSDSKPSRDFAAQVEAVLSGAGSAATVTTLRETLAQWKRAGELLQQETATRSSRVRALVPLFEQLTRLCDIGTDACAVLANRTTVDDAWRQERLDAITSAAEPFDACEFPFVPALRRLVEAAGKTSP